MQVDWRTPTAVYGAALSSAVALYQIWKDRVRVRVGAKFELSTDAGVTKIHSLVVRITNLGSPPVTIRGVFTCKGKEKCFWNTGSTRGLPKTLARSEETPVSLPGPWAVIANLTALGVVDTREKEWKLPRRTFNQLKRAAQDYPQENK